jgi:hypothetical protein
VLKSKGLGTRGLLVNHFGDSFGMLCKPLKISGRTLWPAATSVTVTFFSYSFYTPKPGVALICGECYDDGEGEICKIEPEDWDTASFGEECRRQRF